MSSMQCREKSHFGAQLSTVAGKTGPNNECDFGDKGGLRADGEQ